MLDKEIAERLLALAENEMKANGCVTYEIMKTFQKELDKVNVDYIKYFYMEGENRPIFNILRFKRHFELEDKTT